MAARGDCLPNCSPELPGITKGQVNFPLVTAGGIDAERSARDGRGDKDALHLPAL